MDMLVSHELANVRKCECARRWWCWWRYCCYVSTLNDPDQKKQQQNKQTKTKQTSVHLSLFYVIYLRHNCRWVNPVASPPLEPECGTGACWQQPELWVSTQWTFRCPSLDSSCCCYILGDCRGTRSNRDSDVELLNHSYTSGSLCGPKCWRGSTNFIKLCC